MKLDQTKKAVQQLNLSGILDHLESRLTQAVAQNLSHQDFLSLLLQDELLYRKGKRGEGLNKKAKFRYQAELEDWDQSYERGLSKVQFKDLAGLGFLRNLENLVILGKTGEGKTHLAIALGKALCRESVSVGFFSINFLFEEIMAVKASNRYLVWLKKITSTEVLVLDDFGLRNYTHEEASWLLDLLEERYRKGVLIITSQVDPLGWKKLFEDQVISDAITDRMIKPSRTVTLKGGSYREKLAKKSNIN